MERDPRHPVLELGAFCFACCGLVAPAHAGSWDFFAHFFTFWVTPILLFCGVFFDVTRFRWFVQRAAWPLPMTHLLAVVRPLVTATALDPVIALGHDAKFKASRCHPYATTTGKKCAR